MSSEVKSAPKPKGHAAKQLGWRLMIVGVVLAVITGSFGIFPGVVFFAGVVSLIVWMIQRDPNAT
jgi:hypothetical protein